MGKFETIGLVGKTGDPRVAATLATLVSHLQNDSRLILESRSAEILPDHALEIAPISEIADQSDLCIVVGGDGTLLHVGHCFADSGPPLVGINLGRLGFLVDISPNDMLEQIDQILLGDYIEEERLLLRTHISNGSDHIGHAALNDVVLHKHNVARMIEFETSIDGQFLNRQRSDGLIVSTPTGSTAYALSGGGPIVHPSLNAIVLVPICPHTMSNRPIVVRGDSTIEISIANAEEASTRVTCDGQSTFNMQPGQTIRIQRCNNGVRLLHPVGYDYYESLRARLRWAGHH